MSLKEKKSSFKVSCTADHEDVHHLFEHVYSFDNLSEAMLRADDWATWPWIKNVWITEYNADGDEIRMYLIKREENV